MPRPEARIANEASLRQQKDGSFNTDWSFPKNAITYFFLLPPWGDGVNSNQKNLLAREVREIFIGRGRGSWTCWMSYQTLPQAPADIHRRDLVTNYVFDQYREQGKPENLKDLLPNRKYYANILLESFSPIDSSGNIGQVQRFDVELWNKAVTARCPVGVYQKLTDFAMDKRLGAPFYLPDQAAMIAVKRTGEGFDTEYEVGFAEGQQQQGLFIPNRVDLYAARGEEIISDLLGNPMGSNLPDLDVTEYPWPGDLEKMKAEAEEFLVEVKKVIAGGGVSNDGPPPSTGIEGVAPAPQGLQYGPPPTGPAPGAPPPTGAPPVMQPPQGAPTPQPTGPAPQIPQPAPQAQPAFQQPAPQVPQLVGPPAQATPVHTAPPPVGPPPTVVQAPGIQAPQQPLTPSGMAPGAGLPPSP